MGSGSIMSCNKVIHFHYSIHIKNTMINYSLFSQSTELIMQKIQPKNNSLNDALGPLFIIHMSCYMNSVNGDRDLAHNV